jgi:hypothetical protein
MLKRSLLFVLLFCTCGPAKLFANETDQREFKACEISTVNHLGREHFRIKTASAIYLYDPVAGGFSSIFDKLGNDWISYQDDEQPEYPAAAATKYRGVPNLVYGGDDDGAGHPGHQKCESRMVGSNRIHTVSTSGKWAWTWTFYPNAAKLEVEKTPANKPYWFLYEGPVGGTYRPNSTFWATDLTNPSYEINDHFAGDIYRAQHQYMFFGEDNNPYIFFMMQTTPDDKPDHISYLGNEKVGAKDSPDGMVVAGFGRTKNATPLLLGANTFIIGLSRYKVKDRLSPGKTRRRLEKLARKRSRAN